MITAAAGAAHRPALDDPSAGGSRPRTVEAPPTTSDHGASGTALQSSLPMLGAVSSVIMIVVLRHSNRSSSSPARCCWSSRCWAASASP